MFERLIQVVVLINESLYEVNDKTNDNFLIVNSIPELQIQITWLRERLCRTEFLQPWYRPLKKAYLKRRNWVIPARLRAPEGDDCSASAISSTYDCEGKSIKWLEEDVC